MKVALIRCPCISLPNPPSIGMAYLKSFLKNAGHEVFIFDLNAEMFHYASNEKHKIWNDTSVPDLIKLSEEIISGDTGLFDQYVRKILETKSTVIGFSVWNSNMSFSLKLARELKRNNGRISIIFGGPECFPKWSGRSLAKEDCIDAVVYGEGEETLREIIDYLGMAGRVGFRPGTIVYKNDHLLDCGQREPIKNLDNMPFPDFDEFPLDKYITKELPILFDRGCPKKCKFCTVPNTIPQYRYRTAVSLFEEIKYQLKKYPHLESFHNDSPALNSNLGELSKLCDLIIDSGLKISWSGFAAFKKGMDLELLKKMKAAGCSGLNIGLESGSQSVLDKMGKNLQVEDMERNIRDIYEAGIETVVNLIIGFPGETEDDFQQTLDFFVRNGKYITSIGSTSSCWMGPYMDIFEHADEFGIDLSLGWTKWSCEGNNYEIRKAREEKFKKFVNSLGIDKSYFKLPEKI